MLLLFPEKITIYKLASKNFNNNKLRLQTPWCSEKMTEKSSSIPLHLLISISMVGNTLLNNRHPHSRVQDSSAAFYTSVQRIYHCAATAAKQLNQWMHFGCLLMANVSLCFFWQKQYNHAASTSWSSDFIFFLCISAITEKPMRFFQLFLERNW